jgi:hypothetical protein
MEVFHRPQIYCGNGIFCSRVNVLGSLLSASERPWSHRCRFQETNYRMAPSDLPLHLPIVFGRLYD